MTHSDHPKRAKPREYDCEDCKDWGTVLVGVGTAATMELCPAMCQAAHRFEQIKAEAAGRQAST